MLHISDLPSVPQSACNIRNRYTFSFLSHSYSFRFKNIDVVIAPAVGGIVLVQRFGRLLNKRTVFSERENSEMKLRRGFEINKGENVLICEDVVTTGGSVFEVIELIKIPGANLSESVLLLTEATGKS